MLCFLWGPNDASYSSWIFMCTTTNSDDGFVQETKSHAPVWEKSPLSGGRLDPSLLTGLPPVLVNDAEKAGVKIYIFFWKDIVAEVLFFLFGRHKPSPVLEHQQWVDKKPPCLGAVNWGIEVINVMFQSVNLMSLSVKKTEKKECQTLQVVDKDIYLRGTFCIQGTRVSDL